MGRALIFEKQIHVGDAGELNNVLIKLDCSYSVRELERAVCDPRRGARSTTHPVYDVASFLVLNDLTEE